jgi:hypothetical protein
MARKTTSPIIILSLTRVFVAAVTFLPSDDWWLYTRTRARARAHAHTHTHTHTHTQALLVEGGYEVRR